MKVTSFKSVAVSVPVQYPVVSCVRKTDRVVFVLLDIATDEGITGIAYVQAFNKNWAQAIRLCLNQLESAVSGEDPLNREQLWLKMLEQTKLAGNYGLAMFAVSLVDIALWDIAGKAAGLPVCRLLGGAPGTFEAYQSDGLWLVSAEEAAKQAEAFADAGFRAMKMRLGRSDRGEDLLAVREVRRAVGDRIELMGDVNQGWSVETAESLEGRLLAQGLRWLEEPVEADNLEDHVRLARTTSLPVATGENLYGVRSFHNFLRMDAADVYTPDLQRTGGVTGWRRVQTLLEQYGKPSSIHLFPEIAVHLFPVIRRPLKLEWMSWAGALFQQPLDCSDGCVRTPDRSGFGMEWDMDAIEAYTLD
jgi:L-alanine-DL-glutamate epimerase-like enolase superfamily enzyme